MYWSTKMECRSNRGIGCQQRSWVIEARNLSVCHLLPSLTYGLGWVIYLRRNSLRKFCLPISIFISSNREDCTTMWKLFWLLRRAMHNRPLSKMTIHKFCWQQNSEWSCKIANRQVCRQNCHCDLIYTSATVVGLSIAEYRGPPPPPRPATALVLFSVATADRLPWGLSRIMHYLSIYFCSRHWQSWIMLR